MREREREREEADGAGEVREARQKTVEETRNQALLSLPATSSALSTVQGAMAIW